MAQLVTAGSTCLVGEQWYLNGSLCYVNGIWKGHVIIKNDNMDGSHELFTIQHNSKHYKILYRLPCMNQYILHTGHNQWCMDYNSVSKCANVTSFKVRLYCSYRTMQITSKAFLDNVL